MTPQAAMAATQDHAYLIRELEHADLLPGSGFFETLSALTKAPFISEADGLRIFEQYRKGGKKVYVATVSGYGIVSTVTLMIEPKFIHGGEPVAHIEDVVTRKEWEHRGIASALMVAAINEAKRQGCYKAILDCSLDTVPFYENQDFREHEIQMRRNL